MSNDSRYHRVSDAATTGGDIVTLMIAGGVTVLTLGVAFGLLALDVRSFWVAFPVGFGVVLPGAIALARTGPAGERRNATASRTVESSTSLEVLRGRYAAGELSDEEFEHRVERLLESEVDGPGRGPGTNIARR
ncbi:MAG: SHOCT domain-containing protein [Haloarcula sp.]